MEHQDAEMSDIIVVLDECNCTLDALVLRLKSAGMCVETTDSDNGVVEGCVLSNQLKALEQIPGVKCVRDVFNYVADFPVGDPRNADDDERCDEHIPR
jgi:hypothetical protein